MDYDLDNSIPTQGTLERGVYNHSSLDLDDSRPESAFDKIGSSLGQIAKAPVEHGLKLASDVATGLNDEINREMQLLYWPIKRFIEHPIATAAISMQRPEENTVLGTAGKIGQALLPKPIPEEDYGTFGKMWENYFQDLVKYLGIPDMKMPDWYLPIATFGSTVGISEAGFAGLSGVAKAAMFRKITPEEFETVKDFFAPVRENLKKSGVDVNKLFDGGTILVNNAGKETFLSKNVVAVLKNNGDIEIPRWMKIKKKDTGLIRSSLEAKNQMVVEALPQKEAYPELPSTGKEIVLKGVKASSAVQQGSQPNVAGEQFKEALQQEPQVQEEKSKTEQNVQPSEEINLVNRPVGGVKDIVDSQGKVVGEVAWDNAENSAVGSDFDIKVNKKSRKQQIATKAIQKAFDSGLDSIVGRLKDNESRGFWKKIGATVTKENVYLSRANFDKYVEGKKIEQAKNMVSKTEETLSKEAPPSKTKGIIREQTGQVKDQGEDVSERTAFLESLKQQVKAASQATKATREEVFDTQSNLIKLINQSDLEATDKSKFLTTIKNIQTQKDFQKALAPTVNKKGEVTDPGIEARINTLIDKAQRRDIVSNIKKDFKRIKDSNVIAVDYIQAVENLLNDFELKGHKPETLQKLEDTKKFIESQKAQGIDVAMPDSVMKKLDILTRKKIEDISTEDLNKLHEDIKQLEQLGKTKLRVRQELEKSKKEKDLAALKADSKPIVKIDEKKAGIGEKLTIQEQVKNKITQALNKAMETDIAISPMDGFFDLLDGGKKYKGANYTIFKKTIDKAYGEYLKARGDIQSDIIKQADGLGLDDSNFERIGVHAVLQQEGGLEKLVNSGYKEADINAIKLTDKELELYNAMREKLDSLRPAIEETMRTVFNQPLGEVKDYFPFMTDFEAMTDFEIRERFGSDIQQFGKVLKKNTEKGFTKARVGGKQKVKINAMDVFLQHTDNATYLTNVGKETKYLGEIAGSPEYREAVGEYGQEQVREWVDLVARKGKAQGNRIPILDTIRKNTGIATLGFKLSSALVQPTALMDGASLIGPYAFSGARNIAMGREWRKFMVDNIPELKARIGDDPGYLEFGGKSISDKAGNAGLWALKKLDALTASSVASGAYEKYLAENNIPLDLTKPNKEAIEYAQFIMRKTQASGLFKDLPPAISRGELTGNISLDKFILQFQSFMLNRWSLIRHDMYRSGFRGGDKKQGLNIFFWLTMATLSEIGLRRASKEMVAFLADENLDDWEETFTKEFVQNSLGNIPFVSSAVSAVNYGSFPVPSVSLISNMIQKWGGAVKGEKASTREKNTIRAILLTLGVFKGMPGTVQLDQFLGKAL